MAALTSSFITRTCPPIKAGRCDGRRCILVTRAQKVDETSLSRRDVLSGTLAAAAVVPLLTASSAQAFLGFGDGPAREEKYAKQTGAVLSDVKAVLALDRDDPAKLDKVNALRKETNDWVATYRRDQSVSGKQSYGNTYSVLNALAGHFNSFGPTAPLPKKRLERVQKELTDAEKFLARGR